MGDKESSVEAEQEGEKEMKMVLHCPPIYPLPEEIKQMERSETVCCYCGVSYLIFNEFHQLNTRLAQLEAELHQVRGVAEREKAQREALELRRLEWERTLYLEVQREAEKKKKNTREELEEWSKDMERALRHEFEENNERKRREMEEEHQLISEEKERQLREELGDLEAQRLKKQREELERGAKEREKVLSDVLQKANKDLDELRKCVQQLEERLVTAASMTEEAERLLGKEKQQREILRGVCARQQQALCSTLTTLRSSGRELTDIRGFFSQLMGAWQDFRSQILQLCAQVLSALTEELTRSSVDFQKMREEKEHLSQLLMEQKRQGEEQLCRHNYSEKELRETLLRLRVELEEKHERLLSCQRRCDTAREQLSSWHQREEQMNRKCCAAEEEVTRLREVLEKVQQETRQLRREREILIESHGRTLTKTEDDCRQQTASKLAAALEEQRAQNAFHLRQQMEELRREVELEQTVDREKNQLLFLQHQRDTTQLQQKMGEREQELRGVQDELQEERERRRGREEELRRFQQQEAIQLSRAKADLRLMAERNAELQEETTRGKGHSVWRNRRQTFNLPLTAQVALLQETVRSECEEREELTAALSQAQEELLGLRSLLSHQSSPGSPPTPSEKRPPSGNKRFHLHRQARVRLTRSSTSPNTLRPSPAQPDKDGGWGANGGGAGRSWEPWNHGEAFTGEKRREGTLPRLKGRSTVNNVKHKVSLVMERKEIP